MKFRRCSLPVVVAFLAAHITACACSVRSVPSGAKPNEKPADHGCCTRQSHDTPQPAKPADSSCCCDDASHFAIHEEPAAAVKSLIVDPPTDHFQAAVSVEARGVAIDGSPPGRAPDVPLYTLHASLLI